MSRDLPKRVIKFGGSLLELADWNNRLHDWLTSQPPAHNCLLVGGGPVVDAIRNLPTVSDYDDEFLHWICIDLMEVTHRFGIVATERLVLCRSLVRIRVCAIF